MKVLFVGDVHGHDNWKKPVMNALAAGHNIVFLGDYLDTHMTDINGIEIYDNLKDIIELKIKHPERITLLLGNHDYAYMAYKTSTSGFNASMAAEYHNLLNTNWSLFDLAWGSFQGDKYFLATHAGLTNKYYNKFILPEFENPDNTISELLSDKNMLHENLNFFKDKINILWQVGLRTYFPTGPGSIIWADKQEILDDAYKGINQIIGHTPDWYINVKRLNIKTKQKFDNLYFINLKEDLYIGTLSLEF
jgi:3',5'-cyclic AMP phosphodiesterase CpdA